MNRRPTEPASCFLRRSGVPGLVVALAVFGACNPTGNTEASTNKPTDGSTLTLGGAGEPNVPTPDGGKAVGFPAWVGFPADPAPIHAAIKARDEAPLRAHAWRLWAGLNQPISDADPRPLWWTWPTTTQLLADVERSATGPTTMTGHRHAARPPADPAASAGAPNPDHDHTDECYADSGGGQIVFPSPTYVLPAELVTAAGLDAKCAEPKYAAAHGSQCTLPDGAHFQNNGDILLTTESYSQPGANRIAALGYNNPATLATLKKTEKILEDFSVEQVTTKHMYWPIKADGVSALPVYREPPKKDWCRYNGYETWDALVAVTTSGKVTGSAEVEFLFGVYDHAGDAPLPTKRVDAPVHSIDEFYAQRLGETELGALQPKDRWMLDAASRWAHGKPFEPGDYVVAVASHLMTGEIAEWTLQSAWWSDAPDDGPYAVGRPELPEAKGPWAHYLMTISYGIPTDPGGAVLPVAYNPYIELAATHPVATNCRNCHLRAGADYLSPHGPGPLANITMNDPMFADDLLMNFQWVIADRVH